MTNPAEQVNEDVLCDIEDQVLLQAVLKRLASMLEEDEWREIAEKLSELSPRSFIVALAAGQYPTDDLELRMLSWMLCDTRPLYITTHRTMIGEVQELRQIVDFNEDDDYFSLDSTFDHISYFTALRRLQWDSCLPDPCLSDDSFSILCENLPHLQVLDVTTYQINHNMIHDIVKITTLESLRLKASFCQFVPHLGDLRALKELTLLDVNSDNQALIYPSTVEGLTRLESLSLIMRMSADVAERMPALLPMLRNLTICQEMHENIKAWLRLHYASKVGFALYIWPLASTTPPISSEMANLALAEPVEQVNENALCDIEHPVLFQAVLTQLKSMLNGKEWYELLEKLTSLSPRSMIVAMAANVFLVGHLDAKRLLWMLRGPNPHILKRPTMMHEVRELNVFYSRDNRLEVLPSLHYFTSLRKLDWSSGVWLPNEAFSLIRQYVTGLQDLCFSAPQITAPMFHDIAQMTSLTSLSLNFGGIDNDYEMPEFEDAYYGYYELADEYDYHVIPPLGNLQGLKELNGSEGIEGIECDEGRGTRDHGPVVSPSTLEGLTRIEHLILKIEIWADAPSELPDMFPLLESLQVYDQESNEFGTWNILMDREDIDFSICSLYALDG